MTLKDELTSACAGLRSLFGATACSCALATEDGTELEFVAADGVGAEAIVGIRLPVSRGLVGFVAAPGSPSRSPTSPMTSGSRATSPRPPTTCPRRSSRPPCSTTRARPSASSKCSTLEGRRASGPLRRGRTAAS